MTRAGAVIAIDGPSASGKSSTARAVAQRLGFAHLDSGALYRGVTLVALRERMRRGGEVPASLLAGGPEAILRAAEERGLVLHPDGAGFAAYLEGEPVDEVIRLPEVTRHVSEVSADPQVREWVNAHLRELVRVGRDVVVDGRDIGTIVFPQADLKVFLTASPEVRARRRVRQRGQGDSEAETRREAALLAARDAADSTRAVAPLRQADDARLLDTSALTFEQQVERIVGWAKGALGAGR
ncbi:MAG TPA: (d)CMP kinase [Gemmatimonadales bacterium]|nr:(d)CMP kinase [Gemmatimonadales bacterium]